MSCDLTATSCKFNITILWEILSFTRMNTSPDALFSSFLEIVFQECFLKTHFKTIVLQLKRLNSSNLGLCSRQFHMNQHGVTWMLVSKINSQTSVKSVWNRIRKLKERNPVILFIICLSMIEMSCLTLTLLMHWQITLLIILPLLSAHLHEINLKCRTLTFHLKILKHTTGPSIWKSYRILYEVPTMLQQDQMEYTIKF